MENLFATRNSILFGAGLTVRLFERRGNGEVTRTLQWLQVVEPPTKDAVRS
jgi:hypothetical protein